MTFHDLFKFFMIKHLQFTVSKRAVFILASHAVGNSSPLKTTAWEAMFISTELKSVPWFLFTVIIF